MLFAAVFAYVVGRAFDFLILEVAGVYGVGLAILHSRLGLRAMSQVWFPLLYLAFVIPPPNSVLDDITAPLKHFVSQIVDQLALQLGPSGVARRRDDLRRVSTSCWWKTPARA